MLKIRPEQMETLEQVRFKHFEDEMLKHIKEHFSNHWRMIGEIQLRKVIQYAAKQAKTYSLTTEREVCLYLNLMLLLGSDFDTDIQLPWAVKVLKEESTEVPFMKIKRLYQVAMDYLDRVVGIKNEHLEQVLLKLRGDSIQSLVLSPKPKSEPSLMTLLTEIYPQKCEAMGKDNLSQLIKQGTRLAQHHHLSCGGGTTLYVGLMLMLGQHFDQDPQFSWAATLLKNPSITDPETKTYALYTEARVQLDRWMN